MGMIFVLNFSPLEMLGKLGGVFLMVLVLILEPLELFLVLDLL